jgi:6-phosphogluconate dehydrogenase
MQHANIGMVGLGVMGRMLALNMERHGYRVAGYDLDPEKVRAFAGYAGTQLLGCEMLEDFLAALERSRRIMIMVPAGKPVDAVIAGLKPHLAPGDLLIDGGNSHFRDTERRAEALETAGVLYIRGVGNSGRALHRHRRQRRRVRRVVGACAHARRPAGGVGTGQTALRGYRR